jgi:ESS family glutamate:Na+ symporter
MDKWNVLIYLILIGVLLFVGKVVKTKVPVVNKIVIPTALMGGVIGLLVSVGVTAIWPDVHLIDTDVMEAIVYHALALGFISLSLRKTNKLNQAKRKVWSTGMIITSTYALQGFIGVLLVMMFWSDKFIGSGILLALGFGQGPGLAISFGNMWNSLLGGTADVSIGGPLGASYAFLGFLWGGILGVVAINFIARKKGFAKPDHYEDRSVQKTTIEIDTVKEVSALDGLTVQVVIISIIYGLVWLTLYVFNIILKPDLGGIGKTVYNLMEGFNFIIGIGYALLYKLILKLIQKKNPQTELITNNYLLSNISSTCFNYMIAGSVLMITAEFIAQYGLILLVVTTVGGIATFLYTRFISKRVYTQHKDEYFVALYGMLTGVASTGIALLKGLDRNLETPVAEELVLGSGTAITMALPLFGILMLSQLGYGTENELLFNFITLFGCIAYTLVMVVILLFRSRKKTAPQT